MNHAVTRATPAGCAYLDLQNLARRNKRPTQEYLQLHVLEGFLSRLATSSHARNFVLKGGVLLAAYQVRRPTADVDFAGRDLSNDMHSMRDLVVDIASRQVDDGIDFDTSRATADVIRDEDVYSGVRVALRAQIASARLPFHVDINVGDPIWPEPVLIDVPRLNRRQREPQWLSATHGHRGETCDVHSTGNGQHQVAGLRGHLSAYSASPLVR